MRSSQSNLKGADVQSTVLDPAAAFKALLAATIVKARISITEMVILGMLAGFYISLGCICFTIAQVGMEDTGAKKYLSAFAFSVGLMLVTICGAELFTANCMLQLAVLDKAISVKELLKNWGVLWTFNFIGCIVCAALFYAADINGYDSADQASTLTEPGTIACKVAKSKVSLVVGVVVARAIFANIYVCLTVLMALASKAEAGKVLAILMGIGSFVACGFEHCVANMYFLSIALMMGCDGVDVGGVATNMAASTLGNILGATLLSLCYWQSYLRHRKAADAAMLETMASSASLASPQAPRLPVDKPDVFAPTTGSGPVDAEKITGVVTVEPPWASGQVAKE